MPRLGQGFAKLCASGVLATVMSVATIDQASAFGDRCFDPVGARGSAANSMRGAWASASAAWENAVARKHGSRYARWTYSGDRTFNCTWNGRGDRIVCNAEAIPCGRK
jgi:hypothetical protein